MAAVACVGSAAQAAPLSLVEAIDYDTVAPAGTSLGVLGVGTNTISGSIGFECFPSPRNPTGCAIAAGGDPGDRLTFTIAAGTRLLGNSLLEISNASFEGAINLYTNGALTAFTFPSSNPNGSAIINSLAAPGEGPFDVTFEVFGQLNPGINSGTQSFDYEFTLEVEQLAPVPLPATGVLLLAALGLGAGLRRKASK